MLRDVDRAAAVAALRGEGLRVTEWTDDPGTAYPEHDHEALEVRIVLEGTMTIWVGDRPHELGPGDRLDLPPGTPHRALVGPSGVRFLAGTRV